MKNKTKLVLGLSALLAVTAGAATTSTLAWFTTTRTASVQFTSIGVYGATGDLGLHYQAITNGLSVTPADTNNSISVTDTIANAETDVSGDGVTFYKPDWSATENGVANVADEATNSSSVKYYVQFALKMTNSSTVNPLEVFLQGGTSGTLIDNTPHVDTENETNGYNYAAHATRVALFDLGSPTTAPTSISVTPSSSNTKYLYDGTDTGTSLNYVKESTVGTDTPWKGLDNRVSVAMPVTPVKTTDISTAISTKPSSDSTMGSGRFVTSIPKATSATVLGYKYIGVSIWLEGESANCVNAAIKQTVKVGLSFVAF